MFPHTSGSKISQRHQFHQLEPRGVRSFDVKGKQIKGEKKAIKLLETFEYKPEKYAERVNHIFEVLGLSLFECYDMTEKLYKEVKKNATEINKLLNEENSDERKKISFLVQGYKKQNPERRLPFRRKASVKACCGR